MPPSRNSPRWPAESAALRTAGKPMRPAARASRSVRTAAKAGCGTPCSASAWRMAILLVIRCATSRPMPGSPSSSATAATIGTARSAATVMTPSTACRRPTSTTAFDVGEVDHLAHIGNGEPRRLGVPVDGDDARAELAHALDRALLVPARADEQHRPSIHGGDAMSVRILVTGMSGTGKSSALAELARQGFRTVDTDEPGWKDGELWREDRMAELLGEDGGTLFVSGCVPNQGRFYDRFDAVVLLSAPADVMLERIDGRTNNTFGKSPKSGRASCRPGRGRAAAARRVHA